MKALPVSTPTILIIIGIPGAGKSHFAGQLANHYNLPLVTPERIADIVPPAAQHLDAEPAASAELAGHLTAELLKTGASFIIDSAHLGNKIERMKLQRLASRHRYQTLIVWVQVDEPSAQQRAERNRAERGQSLSPRRFMDSVKQFNAPQTEHYAVVSGKHTFSAQQGAVLRKLQPAKPATANKPTPTPAPASPPADASQTPAAAEDDPQLPRRRIPKAADRPIPSRRINIR